jgi:PAS domain S-box-containing protein
VTVGSLFFRKSGALYRLDVGNQLAAIAELKASELARWRAERLGDASILLDNGAFSALVRRALDHPQDREAAALLRTWMGKVQAHYEYDRAFLLDARGVERMSVPEARTPVSSAMAKRTSEILRSRRVAFQDFYRDERDQRVYLTVLVPILDGGAGSRALGVVGLRIDPEMYLYPFIRRWPVPSRTSETLLIRREGTDALVLNELRFRTGTALSVRIPLTSQDVLAVKAALGQTGVVEGRDYRGMPVVGAVRAVPGSPWFMVARIDAAEVNASLRGRLWMTILLVGGLVVAAAGGVAALWRQQRLRHFRERYEAERARAWLQDVIARSLDEIYLFDPDTFQFRFANRGACRNSGYTEEELAGLTPLDTMPEFTDEALRGLVQPLRAGERRLHVFETSHRRKDGSRYPVEVRLQLMDTGAGAVFLAVASDITERQRAEASIRHLNRVYAVLSNINQAIVRMREMPLLFAEACRIAVEDGGFRMAWLGLVDPETNRMRLVARAGVMDGDPETLQIGSGDEPRGLGGTASAPRDDRHVVCNDIAHDPRAASWRDEALARGYGAVVTFPLRVKGETVGTFNLYAAEAGFFDVSELRLLDELAMDLAFAIEANRRDEERRRAEEAESRLVTILEAMPDLVSLADPKGRLLYMNRAGRRMLGMDELADPTRYNLREFHDAANVNVVLTEGVPAAMRGGAWSGETEMVALDGHVIAVSQVILAHKAPNGTVTFFSTIARDITDRRQTEDALRLFRTLIDSVQDIVEVVDPRTGRMLDVNERGRQELGYSREEFLGLSVWDVDPQVDRARFVKLSETLTTSGAMMWEGVHRRKDGSTFPVEVSLQHVRHGRSYVVATVRNITDRRRSEAELRLQSAALNAAADAIVITDRDGAIVWVNSAFADLTGYGAAEAIGRNPRDLLKSGAHDQAFYKTLWDTVLAGEVWRGEMTNRRKDGSRYPEAQTVTPVRDARGEITHFIAVKRDLTEENRLKAQFLQSQKMEGIGQLAGGIAHDFNNLLTVINGTTELATQGLGQDDPLREDLELVAEAGKRAAVLTRQLLAFSRRQIMTLEIVNLNTLVESLRAMLQRVIGEDIEMVVVPAQGLGNLRADPGQLEQVVMNLVVNARDAMPTGGRLTIETQDVEIDETYAAQHPTVEPGPHAMLAVSDTGVGMDEATRLRIFEPFFTTKELGKGTGLGLSTVYGIVKQSRGSIWVYSEPGKGTTFKLYFPRVEAAAQKARPAGSPEAVHGTGTILIVEDDRGLLQLAHRILRAAGYTVLTASNAGEALLLLERHVGPVDLMLTDVVMPGIGGPALAARLAAAHPAMKVLYTSGYTDDTVLRHGVLAGTAHFIGKPYSPQDLTRKVRDLLAS